VRVICVVADLVASRRIENREAFQAALTGALNTINANRTDLLSPYTITLGDEFQAVYKCGDRLFIDFSFLQSAIYPTKARFSVGVGSLTTPINPDRAIGMDGPAFHLAREGITELKRVPSLFRVMISDSAPTSWINPALDLISHVQANWRKTRLQILYGLLLKANVKAIADQVRLTPAAVYKNIQAGALDTIALLYQRVCDAVNSAL
jgi:hypothetical protein